MNVMVDEYDEKIVVITMNVRLDKDEGVVKVLDVVLDECGIKMI